MQHVAEWCDGWCPLDIAFRDVGRGVQRLHDRAAEIGRDSRSIHITMYAFAPDEDVLRRYRDLGIGRVVLGGEPTITRDLGQTRAFLDRYAKLISELDS
jgi:hypothetical protein